MRTRSLIGALSLSFGLCGAAFGQSGELDTFRLEPTAAERAQAMSDCLAGMAEKCGPRVQLTTRGINLTADEGHLGGSPAGGVSGLKPRLAVIERTKDARASDRPTPPVSVDVEILFDYNSATPSATSVTDIDDLATAITDARFAARRFVVLGHTDSRGSEEYNLKLSERRAESVRARLQIVSGLSAERFIAVGRGEQELKDPSVPESPVNRRVQIILTDR